MTTSLRIIMVMVALTFGLLLMLSHNHNGEQEQHDKISSISVGNITFPVHHRKLQNYGGRRKLNDKCSKDDIKISQSVAPPQPSGIPTYNVQILNECRTGCDISAIQLYCSGFGSANLINPKIFKHLPPPNHDFCLVNNGDPLQNGGLLYFKYTNTFMYKQFSVSSVTCL